MLSKLFLFCSFALFSFSAFADQGVVIYNDPVEISFNVDGVRETLYSRTEFIPASIEDCVDVDIKKIYTGHEFSKTYVKVEKAYKYLTYIFVGLPSDAQEIEVTYHSCKGY